MWKRVAVRKSKARRDTAGVRVKPRDPVLGADHDVNAGFKAFMARRGRTAVIDFTTEGEQ